MRLTWTDIATARAKPRESVKGRRRIACALRTLIAGTGGVIGVWPPATIYPNLAAMAAGILRMAAAAGIDHVGIGTDLRGLVGATAFPDYTTLPALTEVLLQAGLTETDTRKVLGGNYARVFTASLTPG